MKKFKVKHHSLFVDPAEVSMPQYREFWAALGRGEYQEKEYRRIAKGGRDVWIQASYNPVLDEQGMVYKVVKFATDITAMKLERLDFEGQGAAIRRSQVVIEFKPDGTIITANENFLNALGYRLEDVKGKHHSMFVEPFEASSIGYRQFWEALAAGSFQAAQYKRIGRGGREVWIEASYNPILDFHGKVYKVVKYATDITNRIDVLRRVKSSMGEISAAVDTVSAQTANASSAATQTGQNMQSVASGSEELHASVQEISSSMTKSCAEADAAVVRVQAAVEGTMRLATAAQEMNSIVELIRGIAEQVNLLALNATIEAARAGEAGKGFAVVATEVKNLASQAGEATNKIAKQIGGIQVDVESVVASLDQTRSGIESLRGYVTSTAGAVEEQSVVAREMSSNMQSSSQAVDDVNSSLSLILAAVAQVSVSVEGTLAAADSLAS